MTAAELLAQLDHVLLDFDGPVCTVFGGQLSESNAADRLKPLIGTDIPASIASSHDPFDLLRHAASCGPATAKVVETQLRRLELEAIATAPETAGIASALADLHKVGCTVTIVSNHSVEAIRSFLVVHDLVPYVRRISARIRPDPTLLKPNPYLIEQAIASLGTAPEFCVMVTASSTDIDAARAAGTKVIGYAIQPEDAEHFHTLGVDAVISSIDQLRPARPSGPGVPSGVAPGVAGPGVRADTES